MAAVFDDKVKQCDAQIASYTQNLTRMFHKCESRLKNLQKRRTWCRFMVTTRIYERNGSSYLQECAKVGVVGWFDFRGLASRLQELSMAYRKKQKQFFQKLRSVDVIIVVVHDV